MTQNFFCNECDIEFRVKHDADEKYYVVTHCPFCGGTLEDDEHYDIEDTDEDQSNGV